MASREAEIAAAEERGALRGRFQACHEAGACVLHSNFEDHNRFYVFIHISQTVYFWRISVPMTECP